MCSWGEVYYTALFLKYIISQSSDMFHFYNLRPTRTVLVLCPASFEKFEIIRNIAWLLNIALSVIFVWQGRSFWFYESYNCLHSHYQNKDYSPSSFIPDMRQRLNLQAGHFFLLSMSTPHSPFLWQINAFLFCTVLLKKPLQLSHVNIP